MEYDLSRLRKTQFFTGSQIELLEDLNSKLSVQQFFGYKSLVNRLELDFIHSSALLEGNTYTREEVYDLVRLGKTANRKFSEAQMIINSKIAFDYSMKDNRTTDPLMADHLHKIIMQGGSEYAYLGSVIEKSITFMDSSHDTVDSNLQVYEVLKDIWWNYNVNCPTDFHKAVYLHLNLSYISPYKVDSERVARYLQNASLLSGAKMPLLFGESSIEGYKKSMSCYLETGDYESYVKWFIDSYKQMYEILLGNYNPYSDSLESNSFGKLK